MGREVRRKHGTLEAQIRRLMEEAALRCGGFPIAALARWTRGATMSQKSVETGTSSDGVVADEFAPLDSRRNPDVVILEAHGMPPLFTTGQVCAVLGASPRWLVGKRQTLKRRGCKVG